MKRWHHWRTEAMMRVRWVWECVGRRSIRILGSLIVGFIIINMERPTFGSTTLNYLNDNMAWGVVEELGSSQNWLGEWVRVWECGASKSKLKNLSSFIPSRVVRFWDTWFVGHVFVTPRPLFDLDKVSSHIERHYPTIDIHWVIEFVHFCFRFM